jgi:hypothetical protein
MVCIEGAADFLLKENFLSGKEKVSGKDSNLFIQEEKLATMV